VTNDEVSGSVQALGTYVVHLDREEIVPKLRRVEWMRKNGLVPAKQACKLEATLETWEEFGAQVQADGTIKIEDRSLLRYLTNVLNAKARARKGILSEVPIEEVRDVLDDARFALRCETTGLPVESMIPKATQAMIDEALSSKGKTKPLLYRIVYEHTPSDFDPMLVRIEGPWDMSGSNAIDLEALPSLGRRMYGRLLVRVLVA